MNQSELHDHVISQHVAAYRELKVEVDAGVARLKQLKEETIRPLVESLGGEWKDGAGYATIVEPTKSVRYSSTQVDGLVKAWLLSNDPAMKSRGEMLKVHRKVGERAGYIKIK